jgi:hypothetical protein
MNFYLWKIIEGYLYYMTTGSLLCCLSNHLVFAPTVPQPRSHPEPQ